MVVDVVRRAPRPQGRLEVRGSRVPGPEVKGGRIRDCSCVGGSGHGRAAPLLYLSSLRLNPALVSPISRWGVARRRRVRPIGPRKRRHLGAQSDLVGQYPPDLGAGRFQRNGRIADQRPNPEPVEHRQQPVGERVWGGVRELAGRRAARSQSSPRGSNRAPGCRDGAGTGRYHQLLLGLPGAAADRTAEQRSALDARPRKPIFQRRTMMSIDAATLTAEPAIAARADTGAAGPARACAPLRRRGTDPQ